MSYIDSNLLSDEQVIYKTHLHWIIFLKPFLMFLLCIPFYKLGVMLDLENLPAFKFFFLFLPAALAFIGAIAAMLTYVTSEFGLTNQRVIVKIGIISRTTSENLLQKVENIQVNQSIPGRLLGFGNIIIHGTGGTREAFNLINDPLTFRREIQEQIEKKL
jgi:uncharacterized membrane protein YdbT with pleckstrin-like domain